MLSKTINQGGYTVVMGTQTRLSILMRGIYRRYFVARYPHLGAVLLPKDEATLETATAALTDDQRAQFDLIFDFLMAATYVLRASGFPFVWPAPGELPSDSLIEAMFTHYMTDTEGIWRAMLDGWWELTKPFAPPEELPLEALPKTAVDAEGKAVADPNSSAPTSNGGGHTPTTSAALPAAGRSNDGVSVMDALLSISGSTGAAR
jgi:hypothetical protein